MDSNRGTYLILLSLERPVVISTGKKTWELVPGDYVYVGSAMNSLTERVKRHLKLEKKCHWHIDYLREKATIKAALLLPSEIKFEEALSKYINGYAEPVPGFGATDCSNDSNLYRLEISELESLFGTIVKNWRDQNGSFFD